MKVVTAANNNPHFPELVKQCQDSVEAQGYSIEVYDLGGLGYGNQKFASVGLSPIQACRLKPSIILDALAKLPPDELLVWTDADTAFVDTIDEVDTKDYDVGLIYRDHDPNQPIVSGVLFVYNTEEARAFIQAWRDIVPTKPTKGRQTLRRQGDQIYLNKLLEEQPSFPVKTKRFPYLIYNNYEVETEPTTKIVHYKTGHGCSREVWLRERNLGTSRHPKCAPVT